MDPQTCLHNILCLLADQPDDNTELVAALEALTQWIVGGGFYPVVDRHVVLGRDDTFEVVSRT